jgi:hypothetical protein
VHTHTHEPSQLSPAPAPDPHIPATGSHRRAPRRRLRCGCRRTGSRRIEATKGPKLSFTASPTQPVSRKSRADLSKPDVLRITVAAGPVPIPKGTTVVTLVRGGKSIATVATASFAALPAGKRRGVAVTLKVPDSIPGGPAFYRVCVKKLCASAGVDVIRYPASYEGTLDVTERNTLYRYDLHWTGTVKAVRYSGSTTRAIAGQYVLTATALTVTGTFRSSADASCNAVALANLAATIPGSTGTGEIFEINDDRLDGGPELAPGQDELAPLVPSPVRISAQVGLRSQPLNTSCGSSPFVAPVSTRSAIGFANQVDGVSFTRSRYPDLGVDFTQDLGNGPIHTVLKLRPKW